MRLPDPRRNNPERFRYSRGDEIPPEMFESPGGVPQQFEQRRRPRKPPAGETEQETDQAAAESAE